MSFPLLQSFSVSFFHVSLGLPGSPINRVATVREKSLDYEKKFQVREKSGNFTISQGNFEKMKKVRKKSGNFKLFKKADS